MLEPVVLTRPALPITEVLTVDEAKTFKPDPSVYRSRSTGSVCRLEVIGFVSSNGWDATGAQAFGFRTFWVNRAGAPVDEMGVRPDHELRSLAELPPLVH